MNRIRSFKRSMKDYRKRWLMKKRTISRRQNNEKKYLKKKRNREKNKSKKGKKSLMKSNKVEESSLNSRQKNVKLPEVHQIHKKYSINLHHKLAAVTNKLGIKIAEKVSLVLKLELKNNQKADRNC